MRCHQTERRLQELLDNRQSVYADQLLLEHLEECHDCAVLARAFDALDHAPQAWPAAPASAEFSAQVAQRAALARTPTPLRRAWNRQVGLTAAVAASLLVVATAFWQFAAPPNPTPPQQQAATEAEVDGSENHGLLAPLAIDAPQAAERHRSNVPGSEVWYRTGRGLAAMSLTGLRTRDSALENDATDSQQQQLLQRAYDTLRQWWPEATRTSLPQQETYRRNARSACLVA